MVMREIEPIGKALIAKKIESFGLAESAITRRMIEEQSKHSTKKLRRQSPNVVR